MYLVQSWAGDNFFASLRDNDNATMCYGLRGKRQRDKF